MNAPRPRRTKRTAVTAEPNLTAVAPAAVPEQPAPEAPDFSDESIASLRRQIEALTANALPSDRERCLASGMDDFIAKPVREEALNAGLGTVLGVAV